MQDKFACVAKFFGKVINCCMFYSMKMKEMEKIKATMKNKKTTMVHHFVSENQTRYLCKCKVPCHRTTYQTSLSSAHLGALNIERFILKDINETQHIQVMFQKMSFGG